MNGTSICNSIADDLWLLSLDKNSLTDFINKFQNVALQSSNTHLKLSKTLSQPEFIVMENLLTAPESGVTFNPADITRSYLQSGINNHRDLSLCLELMYDTLSFSFDASPDHAELITLLTRRVSKVLPATASLQEITHHDNSCPCCQKEKKKIRNNPSIHPLYWLCSHFVQNHSELDISFNSKGCAHTINISPTSMTTHNGITHLSDSTPAHLAINLTEVYNVRVQLEVVDGTTSTQLTAYNSFGETTFRIKQAGSESFQHWNAILQHNHEYTVSQA
ncbi:hypothetical protein ACFPK9_06230 [Rubritalea spongiae]|uniref:Uncharacterized protein n=1 Tax=Rubritalea spongiae TaxID=430797 RepID=A0ABW5E3Q0_9BACT